MTNETETLRVDAIESTPRPYLWWTETNTDLDGGDEDSGWRCVEAVRCGGCGLAIITADDHGDECPAHESDALDLDASGPMMNYYYPVELDDLESAARTLVDSVCVAVDVNGETGLALAGGGMDLSWEICEAFMALGFLPPVHFCDLPAMAGKRATPGNLATIEACERSCSIAAGWMARKVERLASLRGQLDSIGDES